MDEESPEHLAKLESAYLDAMNELSDMSGWEPIRDWSDLFTFRKNTEAGLDKLKIEAYIDKPPQKVCDYFYENFSNVYHDLNPDLVVKFDVLKIFSDGTGKIKYELINVPVPGISKREVIYFCKKLQFDENTFGFVDTSIEYEEKKAEENSIRVDLKYGLHLFEPIANDPQKTHLSSISLVDPKGSLPTSVINLGLGRRSDFYRTFIDILLKELS